MDTQEKRVREICKPRKNINKLTKKEVIELIEIQRNSWFYQRCNVIPKSNE
jgi:hypothetical protein